MENAAVVGSRLEVEAAISFQAEVGCESGRGCARGIASTDAELGYMTTEEWNEQRIVNMYSAWRKQWCQILRQYGLRSVRELVGRSDLLVHLDYLEASERAQYQPAPNKELVI